MGGCASSVKRKCPFRTHRDHSCERRSKPTSDDTGRAAMRDGVAAGEATEPEHANSESGSAAQAALQQFPKWGAQVPTADEASHELLPSCREPAEHEQLSLRHLGAGSNSQETHKDWRRGCVSAGKCPVHNASDVAIVVRTSLGEEKLGEAAPAVQQGKLASSEVVTAVPSQVSESCSTSLFISNQASEQEVHRDTQESLETEGTGQLVTEEPLFTAVGPPRITVQNGQARAPTAAVYEPHASRTSSLALTNNTNHDRPMFNAEENGQFQTRAAGAPTTNVHDLLSCGVPCHLRTEENQPPKADGKDTALETGNRKKEHPLETSGHQQKTDGTTAGTSPMTAPSSEAELSTVRQRIYSLADTLHIQVSLWRKLFREADMNLNKRGCCVRGSISARQHAAGDTHFLS
ncbi:conserved hypothetical protein [Neospora caninum Liverpool]|uniref:Uncharacterized protein n=1 Tax=Neospora caninum (strain Liverpool) TaxID=572307 RepID=F0VMM3_NEOCL|nr:conserved hypothetical protein [Neospora caninum Liverpool]CBZ54969.1 conserved hypothetical protein [Neospora caninum Liverpool]CEL69691.1 TPA: hypothetical protein BN1204_053960 [Neospora caninum Liverpool]|eukprot:XP_003884997.1 conserved hypothetical protein [Neospora caninum Liverpool]